MLKPIISPKFLGSFFYLGNYEVERLVGLVPVPPVSGLPPLDIVKSMPQFSGMIMADYRQMTSANITAVARQAAADMNAKNKYFSDMASNR